MQGHKLRSTTLKLIFFFYKRTKPNIESSDKIHITLIPVRTSRNFFRLGSAFLEGEMAEPTLKKLREVQTQMMYHT